MGFHYGLPSSYLEQGELIRIMVDTGFGACGLYGRLKVVLGWLGPVLTKKEE